MAIDPKLLVIKPVDELTEVTGLQDGDLLFYDGSGNLKRISIETFNNLSKTAKPLKPTDATPTVAGLYMPTEIGTYANAGGLIAEDGFDTLFYFNGTTWTKRALPYPKASNNLPQFANLSFPVTNTATEKVQCVDNFVPYQLLDGQTSTSADTPSTSPTIWKSLDSRNLRIYEDLSNGTILNEKEQVIYNNTQYIVKDGKTAVVGTDLPGVSDKWVSLESEKKVKLKDLRTAVTLSNGSYFSKNLLIIPSNSSGQDSNISINLSYYGIGHIFRNKSILIKISYKIDNINLLGVSIFANTVGASEVSHVDSINDNVITSIYEFNIVQAEYLQLMLIVNSKVNSLLNASLEVVGCEINCRSLTDEDFKDFENQINRGYLDNKLTVNKFFNSSTPYFGWKNFNSIIQAHESIKNSCELNRFTINVDDGSYDEFNEAFGGSVTASTYVGMLLKNYVSFIGNIRLPEKCVLEFDGAYGLAPNTATEAEIFKKCIFHITHNESAYSVYNTTFFNAIKGFKILAKNCRYCIHPESAGLGQFSKTELHDLILKWDFKPALGYLGADKIVQGCQIGMGVTLGEKMDIRRVKFIKNEAYATEYSYAINGHNNPLSTQGTKPLPTFKRGSEIIIEDCDFGNLAMGYECLVNGDSFDFVELRNLKNVHHTWFNYYGVPNTIRVSAEAVDAAIQFAP